VAGACELAVGSSGRLGITLDSGESDQTGSAALKGPLATANRLAWLKLPGLALWNETEEHVFVFSHMLRLYRTPTIDPFVEKSYIHWLRFIHGHRCLIIK
jgi:hypothetical protein